MKHYLIGLYLLLTLSSFYPVASFKWVKWKNVSTATKAALKKTKYLAGATAYDDIIEQIEEGCEVEVATLDMDGDGKMEYAVASYGRFCCGSAGCSLNVFSQNGKKQVNLTDYIESVKPSKYGVISSAGILIKFKNVTSK
ncbi:MAG: hypothetical protein EOO90_22915 [Pedobacter sp.]|nr:MAG: hypothetical protein EOO90_22915 [Pedobacter sp.]